MLKSTTLAALVLATTAVAAPPRYRAAELESIAPLAASVALDINAGGIVAGYVEGIPGAPGRYASVWEIDGTLRVIDPVFDISDAQHINDAGIVAGVVSECPPVDGACTGQLARAMPGGNMNAVGALDGLNGDVNDIDSAGNFVGWWYTESFSRRAILYTTAGGVQNLGTLGGFSSEATAMNDAGLIVGCSYNEDFVRRGFYWNGAAMIDLGSLGGDFADANDVNESGVIVGKAHTSDAVYHAYRTTAGGSMEDLQTLPNAVSSEAVLINDAGVIAGTWSDGTEERMFVWTERDGMVDIGLPAGDDLDDFGGPRAINTDGTMIGFGLTEFYESVIWIWRADIGFLILDDLIVAGATGPLTRVAEINASGQLAVTMHNGSDERATRLDPVAAEDLDADGRVGITDLIAMLAQWGPCEACIADINGDGFVTVADLLALIAAWS